LPKKPGEVELQVMKEMFEASVDGQPYDAERWSKYFKPSNFKAAAGAEDTTEGAGTSVKPAAPIARPAAPKATPVAEAAQPWEDDAAPEATAPVVTAPAKTTKSADDILAMIRNRKQSA
jgi:hypothetical protein